MTLDEAKAKLNAAIIDINSLKQKEILKLSEEVDRLIVVEQRTRLEKLLKDGPEI